jgi:hypothetical protein
MTEEETKEPESNSLEKLEEVLKENPFLIYSTDCCGC